MKLTIVVLVMGLGGLSVLYGAQAQEDPIAKWSLRKKAELAGTILTAATEELTRLGAYKLSLDNSEVGINCSSPRNPRERPPHLPPCRHWCGHQGPRYPGERPPQLPPWHHWGGPPGPSYDTKYGDYNRGGRQHGGRRPWPPGGPGDGYPGDPGPNGGHEVTLRDVNVKMEVDFTDASGNAEAIPIGNTSFYLQGQLLTMEIEFSGTGKVVYTPWRGRNLLQHERISWGHGGKHRGHRRNHWEHRRNQFVRANKHVISTFSVDIELSEKNGMIEVKPLSSNGTAAEESSNRHRPKCILDRETVNEAIRKIQDSIVAHLANLVQNVFATRDVGETTTTASPEWP